MHREVRSHASDSSSARSDSSGFKFIATLGSTLLEEAVEATLGERETAEPEAETKFAMCQSWQPEMPVAEEAPYKSSEYVYEEKSNPVCEEVFDAVCEEKSDPVCEEVFDAVCEDLPEPVCEEVSNPPYELFEPMCEEITKPESEPEPKVVEEKPKKKGKGKKGKKDKKDVTIKEISKEIFEAEPEPELARAKSKKKGKGKKEKKGKGIKEKKGKCKEEEDRVVIEDLPKFIEALYELEELLPNHEPVVENDRVVEDILKMEELDTKTKNDEVDNSSWNLDRGKPKKKNASFSSGTLDEDPTTEHVIIVSNDNLS